MYTQLGLFFAGNTPQPHLNKAPPTTHVGLLFTTAAFYTRPGSFKSRRTVSDALRRTDINTGPAGTEA